MNRSPMIHPANAIGFVLGLAMAAGAIQFGMATAEVKPYFDDRPFVLTSYQR